MLLKLKHDFNAQQKKNHKIYVSMPLLVVLRPQKRIHTIPLSRFLVLLHLINIQICILSKLLAQGYIIIEQPKD